MLDLDLVEAEMRSGTTKDILDVRERCAREIVRQIVMTEALDGENAHDSESSGELAVFVSPTAARRDVRRGAGRSRRANDEAALVWVCDGGVGGRSSGRRIRESSRRRLRRLRRLREAEVLGEVEFFHAVTWGLSGT